MQINAFSVNVKVSVKLRTVTALSKRSSVDCYQRISSSLEARETHRVLACLVLYFINHLRSPVHGRC